MDQGDEFVPAFERQVWTSLGVSVMDRFSSLAALNSFRFLARGEVLDFDLTLFLILLSLHFSPFVLFFTRGRK